MKSVIKLATGATLLAASIAANAEIKVGGVVEPILEMEVTEEANITNLDLSKSATNLLIATAKVNSNIQKGYTVAVTTANNCILKPTNKAVPGIGYGLVFNEKVGGTGSLVTCNQANNLQYVSPALTDGKTVINASHTLAMRTFGKDKAAVIADTYTDTITMNIKAN